MSIMNATIQNSSFINSSLIKGQLETLIMTNINISSIKLNSVNGLVHAWGSSNIQINIFEYRQISQYIGGIPIYLSGSHIILKHIMISNQNISNHPLEGMLQIQAQNVIITKITFEYIYGLYNNPILIVKSSDQRFIFNLTDLYINSIYMQIGKINNLIQITSDIQGETFINNSIIDNLFLTDTIRIMDITSENIHISNTQINISNLHSGFQLLSKIVVVERLYLNTIDQQNDQFTHFIRIIANSILMSELKLLSRLLIFGVMTPQNITMSDFQLINSYMYIQAFDLANALISIDNFHQVSISNNIFVGNGSFHQIVIFMISQVYRTVIKDCEIFQMYNFLCTQQLDEFSQINIKNISYNLNFQFVTSFQLYFIQIFQGQHIIIIIRKVVFENIGIMKFCTLIQLKNITELIINGFSIQYLSLERTIIQIFSTQRSKSIHYQLDFRTSFKNMTFRNIQLSFITTESISLINIEAKQLIFQVDRLIFSHIVVDGQFNKILTISSIQEKTDIINLNLLSCQCKDSCFSFNSLPANSDQIKIMNISISNSQFINNVASYLFMLQMQQKGKQQQMMINNSIFLQNQFSLTPALQVNQSINIAQSDIEYNTPPINQSQYKSQHSSGREYLSDIQIQMSTDNGQQYVLNRQIRHFQYEVKIKRRASTTNTFYIPTGQYFKDFILFDYKTHNYTQISIQLQFQVKNASSDVCNIKYLNQSYNFKLQNKNWNSFMITSKPNTIVEFNVSCLIEGETYSLIFFGKVLECQIGEILLDNICFRCPLSIQQYSVKKYSSYCKSMDHQKMSEVYYGLINLNIGYWRPSIQNDIIEECNQYQQSCKGGFNIADKICKQGYIGAICSDCDLNNQMGYGRYVKNSANQCEQCQFSTVDILKFIIYVIMQQIQLFSSAYFLLSNAQQFLQISRVRRISKAVKQKFVLYDFPADRITIYAQFLLEYFQTLTLTNNYSIVQLIPFILRPNIFENASFTYMNYIDCFVAPLFGQDYWIYNRLFYLLSCYVIIFYTYLILYLICLKYKKFRYLFIMISVPLLNLYSNNIISFITQIFLLTIPIQYSQIFWIQTRTSHQYFTATHKQAIISIVMIQVALMVIIPLIFYLVQLHKIIKNMKSRWTQSFTYLIYQYRKECHFVNYLIKLNSLTLIIVVYLFQRQVSTRIFILIIMALMAYCMFNKFYVYKYQVLNRLIIQIQLLFMTQLIINGIVESSQQWYIQYLLKLLYYFILIIIIYMVCLKAFPDIDLYNIKWTDKVRSRLGLQLRFYKIKQIKQRFQWIRNNLSSIIDHSRR